jgi:hypothetical protein
MVSASASLEALIFDCDGVILESENLHRQAYNDAFANFGVRCPPASADPLYWDEAFYDELQNRIGGGKPKMRWYVRKFALRNCLTYWLIACDDHVPCAWCFARKMHWGCSYAYVLVGCQLPNHICGLICANASFDRKRVGNLELWDDHTAH